MNPETLQHLFFDVPSSRVKEELEKRAAEVRAEIARIEAYVTDELTIRRENREPEIVKISAKNLIPQLVGTAVLFEAYAAHVVPGVVYRLGIAEMERIFAKVQKTDLDPNGDQRYLQKTLGAAPVGPGGRR